MLVRALGKDWDRFVLPHVQGLLPAGDILISELLELLLGVG